MAWPQCVLPRWRAGVPHIFHQQPRRRGDGSTWSYLDITPPGRQETWEDSPEGYPQTAPYKWWNWHANYDAEASPDQKWVEVSEAGEAAFRKRDVEEKASERQASYSYRWTSQRAVVS